MAFMAPWGSMAPLGDPFPRAHSAHWPGLAHMAPWPLWLLLVIRSPGHPWLTGTYGPHGSLVSMAPFGDPLALAPRVSLGDLLSHWLLWLPGFYGPYGSHGPICFLLLIRYPGPYGSLALTLWPHMAPWPLWPPLLPGPYGSSW